MRTTFKICITCLMFKLATSASIIDETKSKKYENSIGLSKVVRYIIDAKLRSSNRRRDSLDTAGKLIDIARNRDLYRQTARGDATDDHAFLVEKELKVALSHKKSALHDRPYIEKRGKNDFLVMQPEIIDPFVTVVPNHVYYDIEKSCVNWLDDCSVNGIRERLLQGSRSRK